MKHNFLRKISLLATCYVLGGLSLFAQKTTAPPIPLDPNVRTGTLENGLTYYVRHNQEPKDRASFYIVQNVGAVLENDNQNGLAHFLEHMAFNGTQNFPGKKVLKYLEKNGVAFGRNINAYTNVDETVYNLSNIPTSNENLLDSALLVLHDWSNYLSLENEEIDSERGVIREEWRTRRSGGMRVYLEQNKLLYKGSKYAKRDVIGDLDVINNFEYQVIKDFYHDWYRTDLQAIIVVGDIDAEKFENKIKKLFAHIPAVENPKERIYYDFPENEEPIVGVITDPEASRISFDVFYKHKAAPLDKKDLAYYRQQIISSLISTCLNDRYNELVQKGNPPFVYAYGAYYNRQVKLDVFQNSVSLKEDNIIGGIETMLKEAERLNRYGIVASELERAKTAMLSQTEKLYKERNKQNSDRLVREYQSHYLRNEPAPGIEFEYMAIQQLLPGIKIDELNAIAKSWMSKNNIVITLTAPEKEGLVLPNEKQLLDLLAQSKQKDLLAYEDKVISEPLLAKLPKAGKVVKEQNLKALEAVEWTLDNGAKVVVKKTNFKENEIRLSAFSKGGSSLYSAKDLPSIETLSSFITNFGIGKFDYVSLQKLLTGKEVRVSPYVSKLSEGISGSTAVKDFETLLQLVHMYFEQARFDQDAFTALKGRYLAYVANMGSDLNKVFRDSISLTASDHHPRTILFDTKMIEKLDFETMKKVYQERIADASDFTFVFVGNIDMEKAKPMIETYLGSIKSLKRSESWKDNGVDYPEKDTYNHFEREMETPKTSIHIDMHGDIEYSKENAMMMTFVSKLLSKRYLDTVREEEGGSYGVGVGASIDKFPQEEYNMVIQFDTDPAKADHLKKIVYQEVENLYKKGVEEEDLIEVKKNAIKERQENLRKNGYWLGAINRYYTYQEDFTSQEEFEKMIHSVSKEKVQNFAKKYFSSPKKIEVVMSPLKKAI